MVRLQQHRILVRVFLDCLTIDLVEESRIAVFAHFYHNVLRSNPVLFSFFVRVCKIQELVVTVNFCQHLELS